MNQRLWSCAALFALFVTVESLSCYTCDSTVLGYCVLTESQNCTKPNSQCYSGVASFTSEDMLDIHSKGCTTQCKNSTGPILNVNYTITMHCCKTNLCNGAPSVHTPLMTAAAAALVTMWTKWSL